MYGKFFASTFTGSMYGAGTDVFAVWGYVIAHAVDGQVEINPKALASTLGATEEGVQKALDYLLAEDPNSRSKDENGRRLVRVGQFTYDVPTHEKYRSLRNEEERREYNREAKRRSRSKHVKPPVNDMSAVSAQAVSSKQVSSRQEASTKAQETQPLSVSSPQSRELTASPTGEAPVSKSGKKRNPAPSQPVATPEALQTEAFAEKWAEWLQHRREKGKPVTPLSAQKTLNKLAAWGHDRAVRAIEVSITNGWQGVFEEHENVGTPRNRADSSGRESPVEWLTRIAKERNIPSVIFNLDGTVKEVLA